MRMKMELEERVREPVSRYNDMLIIIAINVINHLPSGLLFWFKKNLIGFPTRFRVEGLLVFKKMQFVPA